MEEQLRRVGCPGPVAIGIDEVSLFFGWQRDHGARALPAPGGNGFAKSIRMSDALTMESESTPTAGAAGRGGSGFP